MAAVQALRFLWKYVCHPRSIGAIVPSSRSLAERMVEGINFEKANLLVEFGPGTGAFTKLIVQRKKKDAYFFAIEQDKAFAQELREKFSGDHIYIIQGSAENLYEHLNGYRNGKADVIISGLPLAAWNIDKQRQVVTAAHRALRDDGFFRQFQYSLQAYDLLKETFQEVRTERVLLNIPFARVYVCRK